LENKFSIGDQVHHATTATRVIGVVLEVRPLSILDGILYKVQFGPCRGLFYEDELRPAQEDRES
jgi:hypothetical protein